MDWLAFAAVAVGVPLLVAISVGLSFIVLRLEERIGAIAAALVVATPVLLAFAIVAGVVAA